MSRALINSSFSLGERFAARVIRLSLNNGSIARAEAIASCVKSLTGSFKFFSPWASIAGIARKRAIDHLRKRRDVVVDMESMREISGDDGREIAERMVWADEVRSALMMLPEMQREVIEMAYFEGYTQSEISSTLSVPLGTVKTRTARGLQRLAVLLENSRELS